MKTIFRFAASILLMVIFSQCSEKNDGPSERFILLTSATWQSTQVLINNEEPTEDIPFLNALLGDAKFNTDGTGTFGENSGTWSFALNETQLQIYTQAIGVIITTNIDELTSVKLTISTSISNPTNPQETLLIKISFNAK